MLKKFFESIYYFIIFRSKNSQIVEEMFNFKEFDLLNNRNVNFLGIWIKLRCKVIRNKNAVNAF